jgi:UDP-3-O-acyl-N-acetylglucosamine deacetylase
VETVEHVLAALAGLEIDNCLIQLNMPEPPNCDGSSSEFVSLLQSAEPVIQSAPRLIFTPGELIRVFAQNGSFIEFLPPPVASNSSSYLRIDYHLKYEITSSIPEQTFIYSHSPENFLHAIAPARTFIEEHEIEFLRKQGIGKLTTHHDLVVFGPTGPAGYNTLHFRDEPARHKILDFMGDTALSGMKLCGYIKAFKSGHHLNHQLARILASRAQQHNLQEAA